MPDLSRRAGTLGCVPGGWDRLGWVRGCERSSSCCLFCFFAGYGRASPVFPVLPLVRLEVEGSEVCGLREKGLGSLFIEVWDSSGVSTAASARFRVRSASFCTVSWGPVGHCSAGELLSMG